MEELARYGSAEGRWAGFGPYYAMFRVDFAKRVIDKHCPPRGSVLDPFCGRGTAPFIAQASGRNSLGIDSNPAAWVFAKAKTAPNKRTGDLFARLTDIKRASRARDGKPANEFQQWAWHPKVLRFLNAARRELDWEASKTDRTLMGFILTSVHSKLGDGVSNQMLKSKALGPDYSIRWWKERKMRPPEMCPVSYFQNRINWRYKHGTVACNQAASILRGDAQTMLRRRGEKFDLLFTSPPYLNITSYLQDSWIRLWMLREGPSLPNWRKDEAVHCPDSYTKMMRAVFAQGKRLLKRNGKVWVRTDARKFTRETTKSVLLDLWGRDRLYARTDIPTRRTQTAHCGNPSSTLGEVDFLISPTAPSKSSRFRKVLN